MYQSPDLVSTIISHKRIYIDVSMHMKKKKLSIYIKLNLKDLCISKKNKKHWNAADNHIIRGTFKAILVNFSMNDTAQL